MCHNECKCSQVAQINKEAPDFSAQAYHKGSIDNHVSLKDYRGKWVLLFFYPLDFTFVCPTELFEIGKMNKEFEENNCQILGVSIDSVFSHKSWAESDERVENLGFPLLSDLNRDLSKSYNVLHEDGMSLRGTFIIDPDGIVQSIVVNNLPVGRNGKELLRLVKAFQTGELCPINWEAGQDTLGKA